jgi:hypothetical protein
LFKLFQGGWWAKEGNVGKKKGKGREREGGRVDVP